VSAHCSRCQGTGTIGADYCLCAAGMVLVRSLFGDPATTCGAIYPDDEGRSVGGPCARASGHDGKHQDDHGGSWAQEAPAAEAPRPKAYCGTNSDAGDGPCELAPGHAGKHKDLYGDSWTQEPVAPRPKGSRGKPRVSIVLSPGARAAGQAAATADGRSLSAWIERLILRATEVAS